MDDEGITHEWLEFAPETVPETLESHRPVCWNCHVAATFRRRFPGQVTDRERPPHAS